MSRAINSDKRKPLPNWLKRPIGTAGKKVLVEKSLRKGSLHTVCEEAKCPNRGECFSGGTATFLVMGDICTRNCLFCSVKGSTPAPLDREEPKNILEAVKEMNLSYVVLTSVTRDDLSDGGASHIAEIVKTLKTGIEKLTVEVLVPDFKGDKKSINIVLESKPDVYNHNIETVRSVFTRIRPQGDYDQSLDVLKFVKDNSTIPVKSGFMVGLGETEEEVATLLEDLNANGVSIVTIGQYLRPSKEQVEVVEYVTPKQFEKYSELAKKIGIKNVFAGPFVRSSYKAAEVSFAV